MTAVRTASADGDGTGLTAYVPEADDIRDMIAQPTSNQQLIQTRLAAFERWLSVLTAETRDQAREEALAEQAVMLVERAQRRHAAYSSRRIMALRGGASEGEVHQWRQDYPPRAIEDFMADEIKQTRERREGGQTDG